jgi:hypothetical protein
MRFSIFLIGAMVSSSAFGQGTFSPHAIQGLGTGNYKPEPKLKYPRFYWDDIGGKYITADDGVVGYVHGARVIQIIDAENMIVDVEVNHRSHALWIEGYSTKGLSDGDDFTVNLKVPFKVDGSKKYTTAMGSSKTIPRLVAIDEKKIEQDAKKAKEEARKKKLDKLAEEENAKWRTWKDATGNFEVEAKFAGVTNNVVKLKKKNGKTASIPIEQLSESDRKWIDGRKK